MNTLSYITIKVIYTHTHARACINYMTHGNNIYLLSADERKRRKNQYNLCKLMNTHSNRLNTLYTGKNVH